MLKDLAGLTLAQVVLAVLDISIVAYLFYRVFLLVRGTRATQLMRGLFVIIVTYWVSGYLGLRATHWILDKVWVGLFVAVPIVFQPELRRALEQVGRGSFFRPTTALASEDVDHLIDEVVQAVTALARNKVGALLVLERETGLNDVIDTGIRIEGLVTAEFLVNIFIPNTPLHDGAVIIRGNRVMAAGTFLPLAEENIVPNELGSRHRAALGITEHSDAVAIVVSEETGHIALAHSGKLIRGLDERDLRELLEELLPREPAHGLLFRPRGGPSRGEA
ncbi:MAG: TIGR00159 family protein [Clostridia bacterium]|nr:TIGR00159 family protein [Clostridia bacterium]